MSVCLSVVSQTFTDLERGNLESASLKDGLFLEPSRK